MELIEEICKTALVRSSFRLIRIRVSFGLWCSVKGSWTRQEVRRGFRRGLVGVLDIGLPKTKTHTNVYNVKVRLGEMRRR